MKSIITMFRFVWPYLKKFKGMVLSFLISAALFMAVSMVAQTYVIGQFLDAITTGIITSDKILLYSGAFVGVSLCNIVLSYAAKLLAQRVGVRGYTGMAQDLYQRLQKVSPRHLAGRNVAELVNKIYTDSASLVLLFVNWGLMAPGLVLAFAVVICYVFYLDVWCGIIVALVIPMMILLNKLRGEKMMRSSEERAKVRDQYVGALDEQLRPVRAIRLNSLFSLLHDRYLRQAKNLEEACVKNEKVVFPYSRIQENLDGIITVLLMVYCSALILQGSMTAGDFVIINSYVSVVQTCMSYFMNINREAQQYMAYYQRLKELSDIPTEGNGAILPSPLTDISVRGLNFAYQEGQPVLENFSQSFQRDKIYCLAGRNGSGKSTLTDVLLGLYVSDGDPSVEYNGVPLLELDLYGLRAKAIGVSEQEPVMLNGSVGFNITYNEDGVCDRESLKKLLEMVDFRKGDLDASDLDALLALDANALSGGQKQKVSIVKALYKNPELLVLDEPTSALDAESRRRLAGYLRTHAQGRITILVSHDRELMDIADQVVRLGTE